MIFYDPGVNTNITIAAGGVTPSAVTFGNVATNYTLNGGAIGGSGALTVDGGGFVQLNNANTYTGGTVVSNGILEAATTASLPNALTTGSVSVASGGVLAVQRRPPMPPPAGPSRTSTR